MMNMGGGPLSPQDPFPDFRQQYAGTEWGLGIGAVTGARIWKPATVADKIVLRSLYQPYDWTPGVNVATCMTNATHVRTHECLMGEGVHESHRSLGPMQDRSHLPATCLRPHEPGIDATHACGFYAYTSNLEANPYLKFSGAIVIEGLIRGFGRCVLGTKGFRCGKAQILALVLPAHFPQMLHERTEEEQALAGHVDTGLRATYPDVPIFANRNAMLEAFPIETGT